MNRSVLVASVGMIAVVVTVLVAAVCAGVTDARFYVRSASETDTWCSWGGAREERVPWAVPRDKDNNDWYCNWVQEQAVALQEARNSSKV